MRSRRSFLKYGLGAMIALAVPGAALAGYRKGLGPAEILHHPAAELRRIAEPVTRIDESVHALAGRMVGTLRYRALTRLFQARMPRGLAAPQIGINKRMIACGLRGELEVLINPEIVESAGAYESDEECLSLPGYPSTTVLRSAAVTVRYTRLDGREDRVVAGTRLAALLEHEIDHLDGVLYIDRV